MFAGPLVAALLCLQAVNLVHEATAPAHESGQQCEFCLKFERTGSAPIQSPQLAPLPRVWIALVFPAVHKLPIAISLVPESRGPPA